MLMSSLKMFSPSEWISQIYQAMIKKKKLVCSASVMTEKSRKNKGCHWERFLSGEKRTGLSIKHLFFTYKQQWKKTFPMEGILFISRAIKQGFPHTYFKYFYSTQFLKKA